MNEDEEGMVVIGGGAAGHTAVETLRCTSLFHSHIDGSSSRKEGFRGPISLVCKEPHLPYDRPKLSKSLGVCRSGHYKGLTTNNASLILLS